MEHAAERGVDKILVPGPETKEEELSGDSVLEQGRMERYYMDDIISDCFDGS